MTDLNNLEGEQLNEKTDEVINRAEEAIGLDSAGTAAEAVKDTPAEVTKEAPSYSYSYQPPQASQPQQPPQPIQGFNAGYGYQPPQAPQPPQQASQLPPQPPQQSPYGQRPPYGGQPPQYGQPPQRPVPPPTAPSAGQPYPPPPQNGTYGQYPGGRLPQNPVPAGYVQKSRLVAGLLGIIFGGLGLHSFYLGNSTKGVIQILVSIITCGIGAIWGLVEGILLISGSTTVDANGIPLRE